MKITVETYEPDSSGMIDVTFEYDGISHIRQVRMIKDHEGIFSKALTDDIIGEVARGVQRKIELGVITNIIATEPAAIAPDTSINVEEKMPKKTKK